MFHRHPPTTLADAEEINKKWWDERAPKHYTSKYYDIESFIAGKNRILKYEEQEVGDVTGKKLLHMQCHIGLETLSWARLGADVTGIDFSNSALRCANDLARRAGICSGLFL